MAECFSAVGTLRRACANAWSALRPRMALLDAQTSDSCPPGRGRVTRYGQSYDSYYSCADLSLCSGKRREYLNFDGPRLGVQRTLALLGDCAVRRAQTIEPYLTRWWLA